MAVLGPGNPGRILGSRNKATLAAQAILDGQSEQLTSKAIEMAMEGDAVALRLCLERLVPPRKDRPISFPLPKIESAAECSELTASLLTAVAAGDLTPEEGNVVASLMEKHVRIRETSDFEARLKAIEERIGHDKNR